MYKKQQNAYWRAEEIDFSRDSEDFETLSLEEQHFIKSVLSFFASSDGIVNFTNGGFVNIIEIEKI
jgi:ribonucleotide reductase beta subunit family protein with ferritin-like domain